MPSTNESTQGFISNQVAHSSSTQTFYQSSANPMDNVFRSAASVAFDEFVTAAAAPRPVIEIKIERQVEVTNTPRSEIPDNTPALTATVAATNRTTPPLSKAPSYEDIPSQFVPSKPPGASNNNPFYFSRPPSGLRPQESKSKHGVHPALLLAPSALKSIDGERVNQAGTRFTPNNKLLASPSTTPPMETAPSSDITNDKESD
ncbi:hypothetical protein CYLTODRAFT_409363 [Cylindrobasidium torrendii FP15055 ss-10]|uniref:Uncharacterized protein n=1 Tax=Cylindrobasidium torrendii FP15055 ss-10 TaxID=1314674 RepID=A0A0D7BHV2_9AGAR|nr:hypothetical protein CYLTODRAFT_409363 [Cylindrobasidium torrendii FP15055 ss-10]